MDQTESHSDDNVPAPKSAPNEFDFFRSNSELDDLFGSPSSPAAGVAGETNAPIMNLLSSDSDSAKTNDLDEDDAQKNVPDDDDDDDEDKDEEEDGEDDEDEEEEGEDEEGEEIHQQPSDASSDDRGARIDVGTAPTTATPSSTFSTFDAMRERGNALRERGIEKTKELKIRGKRLRERAGRELTELKRELKDKGRKEFVRDHTRRLSSSTREAPAVEDVMDAPVDGAVATPPMAPQSVSQSPGVVSPLTLSLPPDDDVADDDDETTTTASKRSNAPKVLVSPSSSLRAAGGALMKNIKQKVTQSVVRIEETIASSSGSTKRKHAPLRHSLAAPDALAPVESPSVVRLRVRVDRIELTEASLKKFAGSSASKKQETFIVLRVGSVVVARSPILIGDAPLRIPRWFTAEAKASDVADRDLTLSVIQSNVLSRDLELGSLVFPLSSLLESDGEASSRSRWCSLYPLLPSRRNAERERKLRSSDLPFQAAPGGGSRRRAARKSAKHLKEPSGYVKLDASMDHALERYASLWSRPESEDDDVRRRSSSAAATTKKSKSTYKAVVDIMSGTKEIRRNVNRIDASLKTLVTTHLSAPLVVAKHAASWVSPRDTLAAWLGSVFACLALPYYAYPMAFFTCLVLSSLWLRQDQNGAYASARDDSTATSSSSSSEVVSDGRDVEVDDVGVRSFADNTGAAVTRVKNQAGGLADKLEKLIVVFDFSDESVTTVVLACVGLSCFALTFASYFVTEILHVSLGLVNVALVTCYLSPPTLKTVVVECVGTERWFSVDFDELGAKLRTFWDRIPTQDEIFHRRVAETLRTDVGERQA